MGNDLITALINVVGENEGLTGREYAKYLNSNGFPDINKHIVNSALYKNRNIFLPNFDEIGRPAWTIKAPYHRQAHVPLSFPEIIKQNATGDQRVSHYIPSVGFLDEGIEWNPRLELYPWQVRALNQWQRGGFIGVVEAVTGGGKTRLAIGAMEAHLKRGWKVGIIVPSKELQRQWYQVITEHLNKKLGTDYKIGFLGNGFKQSLTYVDILIAIAKSASVSRMLPKGQKGLIIADECHHYGASSWAKALENGFDRRLGLTATYERSDNGIERYLNKYFDEVVYTLDFEEALSEDIIAPFKVGFLGVRFYPHEQKEYDKVDGECRKLRNKLINEYNLDAEPFEEFMRQINRLADGGSGEGTMLARRYKSAMIKRRDIISNAMQKMEAISLLAPAVRSAERSILFAQTKEATRKASAEMKKAGINSEVLDSDMSMDERKTVFAAFEDGTHELIAAPLLLDEGIDVPSADLAIIVAASRSKRQMIQRMGRVLRKKKDGRMARIVILYVKNTVEDPALGAHETFINEITEAAGDNVVTFDINDDSEEITEFLNTW